MATVLQLHKGGSWRTIGRHEPGERPGSISHNGPEGRQVYQFTSHTQHTIVERSLAGADAELAGGALRAISTLGFEQVARLDRESPDCEFWLKTDRMATAARFRFHYE